MDYAACSGKVHSFESFGTLDGPGIRYVVFFQGCPLACKFCHNPDTWDPAAGTVKTAREIVQQLEPFRVFLRRGGVTLSGGEPLLQPEFASALIRCCKEAGFHTAIDTAGSIPLEKCRNAVDPADLILLDIKSLDPQICKMLTGQDNRNALNLLEYCEKTGKHVWIRHVLVPGYTLIEEKLQELAAFIKQFRCIEKTELLPFHKMGSHKWAALGKNDPLERTPLPESEEIRSAQEIFSGCGLPLLKTE